MYIFIFIIFLGLTLSNKFTIMIFTLLIFIYKTNYR